MQKCATTQGQDQDCDLIRVGYEPVQVSRDGVALLRLGAPVLGVELADQGTRPQATSGGGTSKERQNRVSLTVNLIVIWLYI